MNNIRTKIATAVMALATLTLLASEATAQIVEPRHPPLTEIIEQDNSAEARGTLRPDFGDSLACDRQKFYVQGGFINLAFSFRQTSPENVAGRLDGSKPLSSKGRPSRDRGCLLL